MVAGIEITDTDSLEAASDLMDDDGGWLDFLADDATDADDEPDPTPPAAPSAVVTTIACVECRATGTVRHSTGFGLADWVEEACSWCHGTGQRPACPSCKGVPTIGGQPCWYCQNSGVDHLADIPAAQPATTDRTEHLRRIGQTGGMTTLMRHGRTFYRTIGKAGYAATVARHGEQYTRDLLRAKGWQPRTPDLLSDLKAGRQLADLDRAA